MTTFGTRLVQSRKRKNLNQRELAELLCITPTRLNYWEKGKREPDLLMLKKIAGILEEDPNYLLGLDQFDTDQNRLSREEAIMISEFRRLSPEDRSYVKKSLRLCLNAASAKEKSPE